MKEKINSISTKLFGYHLSKSNQDKVIQLFQSSWFNTFNLKTIIDVGANSGQFASSVRAAMPHVKIISFEPIPSEFKALNKRFKEDKNFQSFDCALGDQSGNTKFLLNEFTPTSSLLAQTKLQKEFYPVTGSSIEIDVEIKKLDDVLSLDTLAEAVLLKIDVQGFEDKVLRGAKEMLNKVAIVYVECSFKEFYEGQPLFNDIYQLMLESGFEFSGVGDQLTAGKKGEPTQIDAIFVNKKFIS